MAIVEKLKLHGNVLIDGFQKTIGTITYKKDQPAPAPLGEKRGTMDALIATYLSFVKTL